MQIGNAEDSTSSDVVPSPGDRVTVAESLIRDLGGVSEWCNHWGIKMNVSKTMTIIVSRLRTMHPVTPINYWRKYAEESDHLDILGVTFDYKMTFEKHLRSVSREAPD